MQQLGKEKGSEKIADWVKGVRNHLYLVYNIHQGGLSGDDHGQMEIFHGACCQQT